MNHLALGVDIGGTKIALALVDMTGRVVAQERHPTNPDRGVEAVIRRVNMGIQTMLKRTQGEVIGIGIGAPGHVDSQAGVVRNAVNLGWQDVPLLAHLQREIALPIVLSNDVHALLAGEVMFGAAKGERDVVLLAIGTGLGGAALVNGKLLGGANHFGMEVGHIPLRQFGRLCGCGNYGCAEMYVSGKGVLASVVSYATDYPNSPLYQHPALTMPEVLKAADTGDALALKALAEARDALIQVVTWCSGIFNPARIIIGGGMAQAAPGYFVDGIEAHVQHRLMSPVVDVLQIVPGALTEPAVGAASLVWLR